jgi:hypothetical protein
MQCTVEAFILSKSLWMIDTGMKKTDTQADQPDSKRRVRFIASTSPGATVISQETLRETVATKDRTEVFLDRCIGLISTGIECNSIPGVIIEHGQRMAASL